MVILYNIDGTTIMMEPGIPTGQVVHMPAILGSMTGRERPWQRYPMVNSEIVLPLQ